MKIIKSLTPGLPVLALVLGAYLLWARPYQLHWGATAEEISRPMPGDDLDPAPTFLSTRAITIAGTPEQIWPWLLQMGYERAGFYGYDILENLGSSRGLESAAAIVPELQNVQIGDIVPISKVSNLLFHAVEPGQYMIWAGQGDHNPGGFTWALYPIDAHQTRLVSRIRWSHHSITRPGLLALDLLTEVADHLAVRKVLAGVKGRVEGRPEAAWVTNLEFCFYVVTFLLFLAALVWSLDRSNGWRAGLLALAAGAGWLVSWYAPLSTLFAALLVLPLLLGLGILVLRR